MSTNLLGKFLIEGKIRVVTGLHIGGSTTSLEIGGLDNPVIKDPLTDRPIIPGSSLKGKMRSLSEWYFGLIEEHPKHDGYQAYSCEILKEDLQQLSSDKQDLWKKALIVARLYGPATDTRSVRHKAGPTRLTVRDAFLSADAAERLQSLLGVGTFTEVKTENSLDRVTSEANPRPVERVPSGSSFDFTMIVDQYEPSDRQLLKHLFTAMSLLEHSSLGGGGSRGSGQVKFEEIRVTWRSAEDYAKGRAGTPLELQETTVDAILKDFDSIPWPT
ncbi:MAG: type III-A CRISPR-associated RAMP protein Csm3 [Candidatus Methanomethylicaceae archaeon]